jgi:putative ABC transport system permease protein
LVRTPPGFDPTRTLTAHVTLPGVRYPDRVRRVGFMDEVVARLRSTPGIIAAAFVDAAPLADDRQGTGFQIDGEPPAADNTRAGANFCFVTPGYFSALAIPVIRGRSFTEADRQSSAPVIIINEAFAKRYFGERDPVGRRLRAGFNTQTPREIIGVVGDERHERLDRTAPPGMYAPFAQAGSASRLTLIVRTAAAPILASDQMRDALRAVDPEVPLYDVRTMDQVVSDSVSRPRFAALLLGVFAAVALLLAAVGVFGMISVVVGQRTPEFGVRLALGATPRDLARLVLLFSLRLAAAGLLIGIPCAMAFSQLLGGLLYGVTALDPVPYAIAAAGLAMIGSAAALIPARRAARIDPLAALRAE